MFTEILWIKPKLKPGDVAQMEASLSTRFGRVAKKFGSSLKHVIKGTVFGIGLGLLAKLLNPLQDLEEKIRAMLGQGQDLGDLAARLGTNTGQLKQAEDVAASFGIKPEEFKELLTKFAESIETARKELANPFEERSDATRTLGDLAKETDILKAFTIFTKKLSEERVGPGRITEIGGVGGEKRAITGAENAAEIEKQVLGAQQFGRFAKFLNSDIPSRAKDLGLPSAETSGRAADKLQNAASQADVFRSANQAKDFVASAQAINLDMVRKLEGLDAKEQSMLTKQISTSFNDLAQAKDGILVISEFIKKVQQPILKGLGELPLLIEDLKSIPGILRRWRPW